MSIELKVKVKSLAAEARFIKLEERRAPSNLARATLAEHRRGIVRRESRHTLLAYGYLRGRAYRVLERTCHTQPDWSQVERMVKKYGPPKHNIGFEEWKTQTQPSP